MRVAPRLAAVLPHNHIPVLGIKVLPSRASMLFFTLGDQAGLIDLVRRGGNIAKPVEGQGACVLAFAISNMQGTEPRREFGLDTKLTSLHHQMAESYEQLTRAQLPGPGPEVGVPLRAWRYSVPSMMRCWSAPSQRPKHKWPK